MTASATTLAARIASGEVSAAEVVQVAAHPWRDDVALAAALALETALCGYAAPW